MAALPTISKMIMVMSAAGGRRACGVCIGMIVSQETLYSLSAAIWHSTGYCQHYDVIFI